MKWVVVRLTDILGGRMDPPLSILFNDMRVSVITRDRDVDHVVEKKNRNYVVVEFNTSLILI